MNFKGLNTIGTITSLEKLPRLIPGDFMKRQDGVMEVAYVEFHTHDELELRCVPFAIAHDTCKVGMKVRISIGLEPVITKAQEELADVMREDWKPPVLQGNKHPVEDGKL
jgi:hypothetical protein